MGKNPHMFSDFSLTRAQRGIVFLYKTNFMFREEIRNSNQKDKTILLLADCWAGAKAAGRFAAQMLFDERTQIILLNTYQRPNAGMTTVQSVTPILQQTAMKDLEVLKNALVNEFTIPEASITENSVEGELITVIQSHYARYENLSVVLGQNLNNPLRKGFCRKVISALLSTQFRPLFIVSNFITLIEPSRVVLIAEKEENISSLFRNYLSDLLPGDRSQLELVTHDRTNSFEIDRATVRQFSDHIKGREQQLNTPEYLLYDLMRRSGPD